MTAQPDAESPAERAAPEDYKRMEERLKTLLRVTTSKSANVAQTPKQTIWTLNKAKLYRYTPVVPEAERHPVPLLLVFAIMNRPYVLDLRPGNSFVEYMVGKGYDVYLLDWGSPGPEEPGPEVRRLRARISAARHPQGEGGLGVGRVQPARLVPRRADHDPLRGAAPRRRPAQPDPADRAARFHRQAGRRLPPPGERRRLRREQADRRLRQHAGRVDRLRREGAEAGRELRRQLSDALGQPRRARASSSRGTR